MKIALTIALCVLTLAVCIPAQALTIRPLPGSMDKPPVHVSAKVGPILMEAQSLAATGNYKAALVRLRNADLVKSTHYDTTVIEQMREFLALKAAEVPSSSPPP